MRVTLTAELTNLWPSFPDRMGVWIVDFCGGRKTGEPGEKPSKQGREPTTNSIHNWTPGPGVEPGPQRWEASILTTAPSLHGDAQAIPDRFLIHSREKPLSKVNKRPTRAWAFHNHVLIEAEQKFRRWSLTFFYVHTYFYSSTKEGEHAMLGCLASCPPSSLQQEDFFKSCEDEMRQPSCLLYNDASFPVLKYIVTIGGHMQDLQDCLMSLLIELWWTLVIS